MRVKARRKNTALYSGMVAIERGDVRAPGIESVKGAETALVLVTGEGGHLLVCCVEFP